MAEIPGPVDTAINPVPKGGLGVAKIESFRPTGVEPDKNSTTVATCSGTKSQCKPQTRHPFC